MQSENIAELAKALAAAQVELTNPIKKKTAKLQKKDGSPSYSYQYADIAEVLDTVRPVFAKHGIAITQPTILAENILIVQTRLSHSSGEWMASDYPVCSLSGDHKAMGAALTYARRYALSSMSGVAADDDTDGEGASTVDAPRNGTKARGPDWGKPNQARVRGDWDKFMAALKNCQSAHEIDRLEQEYQETVYKDWAKHWQHMAAEEFTKYRADFKEPGEALTLREQLKGSVDFIPEPVTRADYLAYCSNTIEELTSTDEINAWWDEQTAARKRFRLSPAEESDIKTSAKERLKALRKPAPTTTFVPNARERKAAILDGQDNPMPPRDQSGN